MVKSVSIFTGLMMLALVLFVGVSRWGGPQYDNTTTESNRTSLVGGHFSLTDHTGKRVTEKDFLGKYLLVYFGYTYCPEICPTTLQSISDTMDLLGKQADEVTPLFITVDPERDTTEQLADYVSNFHQRTVGLTGTKEELRAASKAYRVYVQKVESDGMVDFDHSSITFLMGRDGAYISHFSYGVQGDVMAKKIRSVIEPLQYQKMSSAK